MKKTVFVTGGAGFVGANLVHRLVRENYDVHVAVREGGSVWRLKDVKEQITLHEGILNDFLRLKKVLTKLSPYAIFHLATYGAYHFQRDPILLVEMNVGVTMQLLEILKDIPYKHFVVTGSSSEYGKKDFPMNESDILEPNNYYGALKAAQTELCQAYARAFKKPVVILRLFNVYGYFEEKGRLVHNVIDAVIHKRPIQLATGKEARDLIFIEDVVDAYVHVLQQKQFYGEVFNVGTGIQSTIEELAHAVVQITKSDVSIQLNVYEGRPWDMYTWVADMKKTHSLFGWKANHSLEEGLKKTIQWYKKTYANSTNHYTRA